MHGVMGCFVFGQDQLGRYRYSKDEITVPIQKLKSKHPAALLTVEDFSAVYATMDVDVEEEAGGSLERVKCAEEDHIDKK